MTLLSWLAIPKGSHFSLANIPFGIISYAAAIGHSPRPAVAIGDYALDLSVFTAQDGFRALSTIQPHSKVFFSPTLNEFAALGRPMHSVVRKYLQSVFAKETPYPDVLQDNLALQKECLIPRAQVKLHMPMFIRDYTDFFAGMNHAYNCGVIFRGPENALQPNYKHMPVGYHGRASSVVISGTPIRRPHGQILANPKSNVKLPSFAPCERLDMELELAAFICKPSNMGEPVPASDADAHIFGFVLMNDWSARDIQAWEYVPLGPFNAKNFGTTISPWVVLAEALDPFRAPGMASGGVDILPYLQETRKDGVYDIALEVELKTTKGNASTITRTSSRNLLFSFPQFVAHHTSTGCPLSVGDLMGSGTISGIDEGSLGSFLEQTKGGTVPIRLYGCEEERLFIQDGDTITMTGICGDHEEALVGFGECVGTILPALAT